MKKNLIINLITLSFTALLLVFLALAWYVENKRVSANNIIGQSAGEQYTLKIERGRFEYGVNPEYPDSDPEWYWDWVDSSVGSMLFKDIQPGDAFYFRIVLETEGNQNFSLSFGDIVSSLAEDSLFAYINQNLVEYELTSDTTQQEGKTYYDAVFTADSTVVASDYVKPYTYYEKVTQSGKTKYVLTTDKTFDGTKTYYKARFTVDEFPDLGISDYYTRKSPSTNPNAVGFRYTTTPAPAYNYMYPLYYDAQGKASVKVKSGTKETLYNYDSTKNELALADYLIEDVMKVYDIGVKKGSTYYHENFTQNDQLYDSTFTLTSDTTYNPRKTYYYRDTTFGYVKLMENSFVPNTRYYEKTSATPTVKYTTNAALKDATFTFNTAGNEENVTYYYFAIEFNEASSIVESIGSSNCYLFQKLLINELRVDLQSENN